MATEPFVARLGENELLMQGNLPRIVTEGQENWSPEERDAALLRAVESHTVTLSSIKENYLDADEDQRVVFREEMVNAQVDSELKARVDYRFISSVPERSEHIKSQLRDEILPVMDDRLLALENTKHNDSFENRLVWLTAAVLHTYEMEDRDVPVKMRDALASLNDLSDRWSSSVLESNFKSVGQPVPSEAQMDSPEL